MSLFKPAENTMAFFKGGFMGEPGSGKTHTATLVAIGLVQHLKKLKIDGADKPVLMLDTENGSSWVKPMFDDAGIPFLVAKTRAFKDLVPALREAERTAAVLFIDSITHFWEDLQASYKRRLSEKRKREVVSLEFQDWAYIKGQWRTFADAFVASNLHCILCGRLGWEYEHIADENTGKKQIEKSGVKMQAEKGMGYEPNLLVWMERNLDLNTNIVSRTATILKDRSRTLDGKQFPDPTFGTFLPHVRFMALGGKHEAADVERDSTDIIPDDDVPPSDIRSIRRAIVLDEIEALLVQHYPSTSAADKQAKAALIAKHFKTPSWTEISKLMPLVELQANFDCLHRELEGAPSRYGMPEAPDVADEIPHLEPKAEEAAAPEPAPAETPAAPPPLDPEAAIQAFELGLEGCKSAIARRKLWDGTAEQRAAMDEDHVKRMRLIYGRALMARTGAPPANGRGAA